MEKANIWIIGGQNFSWPKNLAANLQFMRLPLPALASLDFAQRPQACLCLDEILLPQLLGLPCPLWGAGFNGPDGCWQGNWSALVDGVPPDPGGWRGQIFLCVPLSYLWDDKQKYIREQVLRLGLNVELGLDSHALDQAEYGSATKALLAGHKFTVHMPFMDLCPGAADPWVAQVAQRRLRQASAIAIELKALRGVFHLGYDARLHRDTNEFIRLASQRLAPVMGALQQAGCLPVLENVFEPDPEIILAVRQQVERHTQGPVGLCLDVGHAQAFNNTSLATWWHAFKPYLAELHLHDNPGHDDLHQAIGSGVVDYAFLGEQVAALQNKPVFTLELRSEEALWQSLRALHRLWGPAPGVSYER